MLGKGFLGTEGEGFLDIGQEIPHVVACGDQHTLILTGTSTLFPKVFVYFWPPKPHQLFIYNVILKYRRNWQVI